MTRRELAADFCIVVGALTITATTLGAIGYPLAILWERRTVRANQRVAGLAVKP